MHNRDRCQKWLITLVMALLLIGANTSRTALAVGTTYTVSSDQHGQPIIVVAGSGTSVTLPQIRDGLGAQASLIENQGNDTWLLKANLLIQRGVRLSVGGADGVQVLRLRSQPSTGAAAGQIDYASFVYLQTNDGTIALDSVGVSSWDTQAGTTDSDIANGRSYLLAKYNARLDITNAELSYLGSAEAESYGVSWRDIGGIVPQLQTRVTGTVIGSTFHHNYYGVYTFQAANMQFKNNIFRDNIKYGFDPHDYSHDFLVEDNQAYRNGSHGFIISRGCYNFTFRRNISHTNANPDATKLAHGFMFDPGSPESPDPQAASTNNLFEQNHAYDNEGYGLRILGSTNNIVRGNRFENNQQGITVEAGSTANTLEQNTVIGNQLHGLFIRGGADSTIITGNISHNNGVNGIYIKSHGNTIQNNTSTNNAGSGIILLPEQGQAAALADLSPPGIVLNSLQIDDELVGHVQATGVLTGNSITANTVAENSDNGLTIKGAVGTAVESNTIERNHGHGVYLDDGAQLTRLNSNLISFNNDNGIRANSSDTVGNTWSENRIFANSSGAIEVTSGANAGIRPPVIESIVGNQISGSAAPGTVIEIFSDTLWQASVFEGRTTTGPDGRYSFIAPAGWHAPHMNAIATAPSGSSAFTYTIAETRIIRLPLIIH